MGRRNLSSSGKRKRKDNGGVMGKNKWMRIQEAKQRQYVKESRVAVEGSEFLSKQQLKNLIKQPTNNIRPSGKRISKALKRMRRETKVNKQMDVETVQEAPSKKKGKKGKKTKVQTMEVDEEDEEEEEEEGEEMAP